MLHGELQNKHIHTWAEGFKKTSQKNTGDHYVSIMNVSKRHTYTRRHTRVWSPGHFAAAGYKASYVLILARGNPRLSTSVAELSTQCPQSVCWFNGKEPYTILFFLHHRNYCWCPTQVRKENKAGTQKTKSQKSWDPARPLRLGPSSLPRATGAGYLQC